ncbi:MAG: cytochrome c oxidase subunit II [Alcanivorax sp.]|nr:cytochrome c oxidase subunit II [Alcanivorax sp.]
MQSTLFHRAAALLTTLMISGVAAADWTQRSDLNMRPGVTAVSQDVYHLHMIILGIVTLIGVIVFALIMWSVFAHRKEKNPVPAKFHENVVLEVVWTVIPFFILIGMAIPATRVLINMEDTSDSALTIKVTGSQWRWHYEYLDYEGDNNINVGFFSDLATPPEVWQRPILSGGLFPVGSAQEQVGVEREPLTPETAFNYMIEVDNPLVVPAGQKIRFLITADDVIHSFWVPDFGFKKDAIPGFVNESWTKIPEDAIGMTLRGQCAELCGRLHAFMPIEVKVKSQEDFVAWLAEQQEAAAEGPDMTPFAGLDDAMELGKPIYDRSCAMCHGAQGQGQGAFPSFQQTALMTDSNRIQDNIDILLHGRGAMPAFRAQLSPKEIAAVITYQRNAFGNETGDLIQPDDVQN